MNSTPQMFSDDLRHFIGIEQWKFATMLPDWPHEYLVRERVDRRLFERVVKHIRSNGYEGRFYEREIRYYEEAGLVYWTIGAPVDRPSSSTGAGRRNRWKRGGRAVMFPTVTSDIPACGCYSTPSPIFARAALSCVPMAAITLTVNGRKQTVDVDPATPLLYILRNDLDLQGPRFGCGLGQCGACSVIINGAAVRSCVTQVSAVKGEITTLEGLAREGSLHPVQQAWIDEQVPQCGFCQNGQIITAKVLLDRNPNPTDQQIREGMAGALCRCMTYYRVQAAVKRGSRIAVHALRPAGADDPTMTRTMTIVPKQIEDLLEEWSGTPSRRTFLKSSGLLVVSVGAVAAAGPFASLVQNASAQAASPYPDVDFRKLDSWIVIHQDNTATFYVGKTDLGQGTGTAFRQMMADELDIAYDKTTCIMGTTDITPDQGGSGGSDAIQTDGPPMRRVAAEARRVLLEMASTTLAAPVDQLAVSEGVITVKADPSKRVTYGELIGGKRFNVTLTGNNVDATTGIAKVKPVQDFKIIGQSPQRYDIPAKVDGSLKWAVDMKVPGMVHARNVKPPFAGAKLISIDEVVREDHSRVHQSGEQGQLRRRGLRARGAGHQGGQATQN